MGKKLGLDVGTNLLVSGRIGEEGVPIFKSQRDAFFRIEPRSEINKNAIKTSLEKRGANFIVDEDGSFIVIGEDALQIAMERNSIAKRPMQKGVLSPREKKAFPILKLIIKSLIGEGVEGDSIVFSTPARPICNSFDIVYHTEVLTTYLKEMGYEHVEPINEAFAICLTELLEDALTGVVISWGAGMVNCAVVHQADALVEFSILRAGDWIDSSVGTALDLSPSIIQLEKEGGVDLFSPKNKIEEAISVYYGSLISYTLKNIVYELERRKKDLPIFRNPVPIVVSGGLALAENFVKKFEDCLKGVEFPVEISEVRRARNPLEATAHGALLAAQL